MVVSGGCRCGAIRYEVSGEPRYHSLCHCRDCRKSAGAPAVSWALFPREAVKIAGEARVHASSEDARRQFCAICGTGLFYTNEVVFPGLIDIQSATLDDPNVFALQCHVQTAERIGWMTSAHTLPEFERYPEPPG